MLILILSDVQYLKNIVFRKRFKWSKLFFLRFPPPNKIPLAKISHSSPLTGNSPTLEYYLENPVVGATEQKNY